MSLTTLQTNDNNDLFLPDGRNIGVLKDKEALDQSVRQAALMRKGENIFNVDEGVDYLGTIFSSPRDMESARVSIANSLTSHSDVLSIESLVLTLQGETLVWTSQLMTVYGAVSVVSQIISGAYISASTSGAIGMAQAGGGTVQLGNGSRVTVDSYVDDVQDNIRQTPSGAIKATIVSQPKAVSVYVGGPIHLEVTTTDAIGYQWQYSSTATGTYLDIPGAIQMKFNISSSNFNDAGYYRVKVLGIKIDVYSNPVSILVEEKPVLPTITSNPVSVAVFLNNPFIFSVVAINATSYQWQKGNEATNIWSDINGANLSSYGKSSAAMSDAGNYRVQAINADGSVTSTAVFASVTFVEMPVILTNPVSQTPSQFSAYSLSVTTNTGAQVSWQKAPTATGPWTELGVYTKTLSFSSAESSQDGFYRVRAYNVSYDNIFSAVASVVVAASPPQFSTNLPTSVTNVGGTSRTLTVASATAETYQWQTSDSSTGPWVDIAGANAATYTYSAAYNTRGYIRVIIANGAGSNTSVVCQRLVTAPASINMKAIASDARLSFTGQSITISSTGGLTYATFKALAYIDGVAQGRSLPEPLTTTLFLDQYYSSVGAAGATTSWIKAGTTTNSTMAPATSKLALSAVVAWSKFGVYDETSASFIIADDVLPSVFKSHATNSGTSQGTPQQNRWTFTAINTGIVRLYALRLDGGNYVYARANVTAGKTYSFTIMKAVSPNNVSGCIMLTEGTRFAPPIDVATYPTGVKPAEVYTVALNGANHAKITMSNGDIIEQTGLNGGTWNIPAETQHWGARFMSTIDFFID